jgi:hypothetical protein
VEAVFHHGDTEKSKFNNFNHREHRVGDADSLRVG